MGKVGLDHKLREEGYVPQMVGASVLYKLPFLRQHFNNVGCVEADAKSIAVALERPYPSNVTFIVPGGIAEIFCMSPDYEMLILNQRKGFVKLALKTGTDLVPTYYFGHTHLFKTPSGYMARMLQRLSRFLKVSLIPFTGRFGLMLPFPEKIVGVIGKAIPVEKVLNPTVEQVEALHAEYVVRVKDLFYKYRHTCPGYESKELYMDGEKIPKTILNRPLPDAEFTTFPNFKTFVNALGSEDALDDQEEIVRSRL